MAHKALVAYFSTLRGNTAHVAEELADAIGADLFEIVPEDEYSSTDLDWRNPDSRCNREHADPSCRPAIAERVRDWDSYDTLFLGFPIWWYTAPRIVETFLESYDLTGKTVALFATSGGSGLTKPEDELPARFPQATWKPGRLFNGGVAASTLRAWANGVMS
jgi:flavodoxin